MSTACLIGRPTGRASFKAVYCHWDGEPAAMVPVLRRLVLWTFDGKPTDAADYLFRYSGFGYWASLTGSGDAYSSAMRTDTSNIGPIHRQTGEPWPTDVDVYHDDPKSISPVIECRNERFIEAPIVHWPQRWLYIIYPEVLAVVRYVAPTELLGDYVPHGIKCQHFRWDQPANRDDLLEVEQRANERVERALAEGAAGHAITA
jgi:hypothetical protein